MESTPYREDPLPSYLENTKSTAYRWQQDITDSTAHPSVGDNTTRENDIQNEDETARIDRVKQLASLLDDLDASARSSRHKTTDLLHSHSSSRSSSPPDSPSHRDSQHTHSQQSTVPSQFASKNTNQRNLSNIHEHSEEDTGLLSDLDEMINNIPSEEEEDPNMSPGPVQSTPRDTERSKSKSLARDMFNRNDISPVRGLKSAQKTPATKTPAKTVDFKDASMSSLPRQPSKPPKTPAGYVAPSPIERRPSSPRKFSGQSNPEQPQRQPSPATPSPTDPGLKQLTAQLSQMQEDIRKRDTLIQDLYKQFQSPPAQDAVAKELAEARRQIEELKVSTTQLKRGQEELAAMSTPEKAGSVAGASTTLRGVRDRIGKWQEYLETPISISQRRSRRETPRHTRVLDEEEEILPSRFAAKTGPQVPLSPIQPPRSGVEKEPEIAQLKEALAKAEGQIAQLKVEKAAGKGPEGGHEMHARPLGPNMMPDAKNTKLARDEKMYYRLGLYKIDRLCSNETANLLKNVLIQLDTPLDQLIYEITNLSQKMNEYDRLQEFAMGVHERIYGGEKMELSGGEGVDVECLREMLTRVGKLASRRK